jgi:hypothetical protein
VQVHRNRQEEVDELDSAQWYFGVVSPLAYLRYQTLRPLHDHIEIRPDSGLFAGLLKPWGT